MRVGLIVVAAATLGACQVNLPGNRDDGSDEAQAETAGFPKAGNYHIVHDMGQGAHTERKETDMWVDASDAGKFEELVAGQSSGNAATATCTSTRAASASR